MNPLLPLALLALVLSHPARAEDGDLRFTRKSPVERPLLTAPRPLNSGVSGALSDLGAPLQRPTPLPTAEPLGRSAWTSATSRDGEPLGPAAALKFEQAFRGPRDPKAQDSYERYLLADPIALKGLRRITEMGQSLWNPTQLVADFKKSHEPSQEAILVFVKTEFCSSNDYRLCSVATAAFEKQSAPELARFKVYGAWVKGHPDHMSNEWFAWEDKVIKTYQFDQGPGAKIIAFLPDKPEKLYFTDASVMELTADKFESEGGKTPTLARWLRLVLQGKAPTDVTTPKQLAAAPESSGDKTGEDAIPFSLNDLQGVPVSLAQFRGQTVLVEFFTSWCPTCTRSVYRLNDLAKKYPKMKIIAIDTYWRPETDERLGKFIDKLKPEYTILKDPDTIVTKSYGTKSVPNLYLIGPDGKFLYGHPRSYQLEEVEGKLADAPPR